MSKPIIGRKYLGKIIKGYDSLQRGRYYVHIPEIMPGMTEDQGILLPNQIGNNIVAKDEDHYYGSYYPLHLGTIVYVEFINETWNSGRIVGIVSDQKNKSEIDTLINQPREEVRDRDEQYTIIETPNGTRIFINENTYLERESLFIRFKYSDTILRINNNGIHLETQKADHHLVIDDNVEDIHGSSSIKTGGNWDIYSGGTINVKAAGQINIDSSDSDKGVHIMCGHSKPAATQLKNLTFEDDNIPEEEEDDDDEHKHPETPIDDIKTDDD